MKNSIVRRINTSTPMILLLSILMSLTTLKPASATIYTYTSQPFTTFSGLPFPPSPPISNFLTIQFTYDGVLPTDNYPSWPPPNMPPSVSYTMTCGGVTIASGSASLFLIGATGGVITHWVVFAEDPVFPGYRMESRSQYFPPFGLTSSDIVQYANAGGVVVTDWYNLGPPGEWTTAPDVPLPPTMLLLGSGLLGLAGWRRFRKS